MENVKITEKAFNSALSLSITKILICMACLVFLTWAWYSIDLANGSTLARGVFDLVIPAINGNNVPDGLTYFRPFRRL